MVACIRVRQWLDAISRRPNLLCCCNFVALIITHCLTFPLERYDYPQQLLTVACVNAYIGLINTVRFSPSLTKSWVIKNLVVYTFYLFVALFFLIALARTRIECPMWRLCNYSELHQWMFYYCVCVPLFVLHIYSAIVEYGRFIPARR